MEGYISEIRLFAANFAPRNWAYCNGQILSISSNSALFSLLGTMYGGNGQTTFGLPNLQSRVAIGMGQGLGTSNYFQAEIGGYPNVTLTYSNLPQHQHPILVQTVRGSNTADQNGSQGFFPGNNGSVEAYAETPNQKMNPQMATVNVSTEGHNIPMSINQPYLGMNYIICMYGIYPSRG